MIFQNSKEEPGFGNTTKLLKDIDYVKAIIQTIKNTYAKYIKHGNYDNFFQESSPVEYQNFVDMEIEIIEQMELNINPHVFLEIVLNDINNELITYACAINRANRARENKLLNDVKILQDEITGGDINPSTQIDLAQAEALYNDFVEQQSRKSYLISMTYK